MILLNSIASLLKSASHSCQLMFSIQFISRASNVMCNIKKSLIIQLICVSRWFLLSHFEFSANCCSYLTRFFVCVMFPTQAQTWCCWITSPPTAPLTHSTTGIHPGRGGARSPLKTRWSIPKVSVVSPLHERLEGREFTSYSLWVWKMTLWSES